MICLSHIHHKQWHLIPLVGSEQTPESPIHMGSLRWANPAARGLVQRGLKNVGQMFQTNEYGHINTATIKSADQIYEEFNVRIPIMMMNSIISMRTAIKDKYI